jgi:hypothetical protein
MYVKYNLDAELRKFLRNKPIKTTPEVLLTLIASEHLAEAKLAQRRTRPARLREALSAQ